MERKVKYSYEKSFYSTIKFKWSDASKTLTIENREGNFPGMIKSCKFKIVIANKNQAYGDAPAQIFKNVSYNGGKISVKL